MAAKFRIEHDSMGDLRVPADALYGAQTQRAVQNFQISNQRMPMSFIHALALLKAAIAEANAKLGLLDEARARAIVVASREIVTGKHDEQFPLDVYQTGSATSSNMNVNEVVAHLASRRAKKTVHANDHVNLGQSSNDMVPCAIQIACVMAWKNTLRPAVRQLHKSIMGKAVTSARVIKTGRTHLMDAMPVSIEQEFSAYAAQLQACVERLDDACKRQQQLPIGGTAVGTGVNADPRMAALAVKNLRSLSGVTYKVHANAFAHIAAQDHAADFSGQLNVLAVCLMKIANDLRWMNSGPLAGLAEIELPALQPGSSIMPGKVNPVIPEAVAMVCARVIGNHQSITIAAQSGNFQLNVMLPLIADCLLQSLHLLGTACEHLATKAVDGLRVREDVINRTLDRNPILVTALNPIIGYETAAKIAKRAYEEQRAVLDVAKEMTDIPEAQLRKLLDPAQLIKGKKGKTASGGG